MKRYAIFNTEGFPTAFFSPDVHGERFIEGEANPKTLIPIEATEITEQQWRAFIDNDGHRRWNGQRVVVYVPPGPTIEDQWGTLRVERDRLLRESDIRVLPDRWETMASEDREAWAVYRQALRDLPEIITNPAQVEWPVPPR